MFGHSFTVILNYGACYIGFPDTLPVIPAFAQDYPECFTFLPTALKIWAVLVPRVVVVADFLMGDTDTESIVGIGAYFAAFVRAACEPAG